MRFLIRILANSLAIYLAVFYVPGVNLNNGDWRYYLIGGIVLSLINAILKPVLKLISLPLIFLTLGLFSLVINFFVIWLVTKFVPEFNVAGFWAYLWTALIISFINYVFSFLFKKAPETAKE